MKIYKKDIRKIIEILESKEKELNETSCSDSYFETSELGFKIVSFIMPDRYQIGDLTEEEAEIIYPYINQKFNHTWTASYENNRTQFLVAEVGNKKATNNINYTKGIYRFCPEDYIEHVIKQDKHYKI